MASTKLTKGSIARYKTGDTQQSPIVKITNVRVCGESSTAASNDSERYRLSISDGQDT
ncbi:unnamed protein product, partial [Adineta steineri]